MKNSLYFIGGLLIVIWGINVWGFKLTGGIHILLAIAIFIIIFRITFNVPLSNK